jgi:amino acid transporter
MQLKAVLGPVQLIFYSVGVIIGAGVYSVIGAAAGLAGPSLWLSFVIGAVVAVLTAISYAEMTTSFPAAGAEYVYVRHALPSFHWVAFVIAIVILVGGAATATTVAVAFGGSGILGHTPRAVGVPSSRSLYRNQCLGAARGELAQCAFHFH